MVKDARRGYEAHTESKMTKAKSNATGKRGKRTASPSPDLPATLHPASKQSDDFEHAEIHRRFMEMCAEDGLSQADAARYGEASTSTANAWWAGRLPDPVRLARLCRKLKWNAHQIITGEGPKRAFTREELAAVTADDGGLGVAHMVLREVSNAIRIVGANYGYPSGETSGAAPVAPGRTPGVAPRL